MSLEQRNQLQEASVVRKADLRSQLRAANAGGKWFAPFNQDESPKRVKFYSRLASQLHSAISQHSEGERLSATLVNINKGMVLLGRTVNKEEERVKAYKEGVGLVESHMHQRIKNLSGGHSIPTTALIAKDYMSYDVGRALAWEETSDIPGYSDEVNIPWLFVKLYLGGATLVGYKRVAEIGKAPFEKLVVHGILPPSHQHNVRLACWVEGDPEIYRAHEWMQTCTDAKAIRPKAPERIIY